MEVTIRPIFFPKVPLMNPRTLWACQAVASMISVRVAPFFRCSKAMTWAVLLPWRGPSAFDSADFLGALVAFFAWVVFWVGLGFSPSAWMRFQIRPAAALALLKVLTGSTPGRLFQISTNRTVGHAAASSASCFWLVKGWAPAPTAAAAWSGVGNAVMLLSLSIVNVFM